MAGQIASIGEDDGPGHVGWPTPEFRLDEIGNTAKKQPDWHDSRTNVRNGERLQRIFTGKQPNAQGCSGEAAMKRHAPFPNHRNFFGMTEEIAKIVKEHV